MAAPVGSQTQVSQATSQIGSSQQQSQQQQKQQQQQQDRQLVLVVEGTAALGPNWPVLRSEYVEKIVRAFCQDETTQAAIPGEMALVVFASHGPHSTFLVQHSAWTSSLEVFLEWVSSINFCGGGFGDVAIAEGLAEALMICCPEQPPPPTQPTQRHCVLVAASNPHRLPTPVPHPPLSISTDSQPDHWWLADAETVAKAFPECHVSLSIICPRQLPLLKDIHQAAKRKATDGSTDVAKHSQHLALISECFQDAKACFRRPAPSATTVPPNPATTSVATSAIKTEQQQPAPVPSVPITSQVAGTASVPGRPVLQVPTSTVKLEHGLPYSVSGSSPMITNGSVAVPLTMPMSAPPSSVPSQEPLRPPISADVQEFKNPLPQHRPGAAASILNTVSQFRHAGVPASGSAGALSVSSILSGSGSLSVGQGSLGMSQAIPISAGGALLGAGATSSLLSNGGQSTGSNLVQPAASGNSMVGLGQAGNSLAPGVLPAQQMMSNGAQSSAQSGLGPGQAMPTLQIPLQITQPGMSNTLVATPPQASGGTTTGKYTRLWQGILAGQRQGRPVPICSLEAYRQLVSPESLAADWPQTMQILRLIEQDYMSNKEYQEKAELLVFRPGNVFKQGTGANTSSFLTQLAEKKLCAVIQLPTQTLLLASADKPQRMIGMLFPGDMVVVRPQQGATNPQQPGQTMTSLLGQSRKLT